MVFVVRSKNHRLNNAVSGLREGLGTGMALGQRSRALADDERHREFIREQAMVEAQRAAAQLARDEQGRAAIGEAAGEMARPDMAAKLGGQAMRGPMMAAPALGAAANSEHDATIARVQGIAQRMAQNGVPASHVFAFVDAARKKHVEAVDKQERDSFVDLMQRDMAGSGLFATQPDDTLMESEQTSKAAQQLVEMAGDPNVSVQELRARRVGLKRQVARDRTERKNLKDTLGKLDTDIATAGTAREGVPGADMSAGILQNRAMTAMRDEYEQFSSELLRDPSSKEAQAFMRGFSERWSQAKNGIAYVDKDFGPVTFEAAGQMRAAKEQIEQLKATSAMLKQQLDAAKLADVPEAAADRQTRAKASQLNAQANLTRAMRGPGGPRPESDAARRSRAIDNLRKLRGSDAMGGMEPITEKEIGAEIRRMAGEEADSGGEDITPEDAVSRGWTAEEWDRYVDEGVVPEGK